MNVQQEFERWLTCADASLQPELAAMQDDETVLADAFFQDLKFGTGGLRGIVGAGPNRMNIHTVARTTQGLADYLNERFEKPSVAIARDSRRLGKEFTHVVAEVLAANNIKALLYPRIEPTPALSWAVRDLNCSAGICITASHNPAPYNGYKVYGPDGCQITTETARSIQAAINATDIFDGPKRMSFNQAEAANLTRWIADYTLDRYIDAVTTQSQIRIILDNQPPLKIVYTPLHGTGLECITRALERIEGVEVVVEPTQAIPDGEFPTCPYPNPEIRDALNLGLTLCAKEHPNLLLATDPDADRIGIAVSHNGSYSLLTGNEIGILLLDYICETHRRRGEDLKNKVAISTIVSSAMADALAQEYGFQLRRTLTGFKFIGEQIGILEAAGQTNRFMFGFEESYGYLIGSHVRDKDAVVASMLICEMARWHRSNGRDLVEALEAAFLHYGYFKNKLLTIEYPGADGSDHMREIMAAVRNNPPAEIAGLHVEGIVDYKNGSPMPIINPIIGEEPQMLPPANVFEFHLEGGNKLIIRPSGTEPKMKAYAFAKGTNAAQANSILFRLQEASRTMLS